MNISLLVFVLLLTPSVLGFPSVQTYPKEKLASLTATATTRGDVFPVRTRIVTRMTRPLPEHGLQGNFMAFPASSLLVATTSFPALAATTDVVSSSVLPSALWAYGHYFSILVIMGCLTAERLIVREDMTVNDEDMIVKLDLVYGLMAALLIISGFARATTFGKGGDYYTHEMLFWAKMTVSGIWGGLSLFPSLTFYKRNFARKKGEEDVPPLSTALTNRLHQIINAEISAILSIPILATLMARGVGYNADFPFQIGLVVSILATGGSFFFYSKQALGWDEEEEGSVIVEQQG